MTASAALVLTGCATAPEPTPTSTQPADPSSTPGQTPTGTPSTVDPSDGGLVLPPCDALLDTAAVQRIVDAPVELVITEGTSDRATTDPAAREAAAHAVQENYCLWGIENGEDAVSIAVAELPRQNGDALEDELRTTGEFAEGNDSSATWFSREISDAMGATAVTYLLDGELWVIVSGTTDVDGTEQLATDARAAVLAPTP